MTAPAVGGEFGDVAADVLQPEGIGWQSADTLWRAAAFARVGSAGRAGADSFEDSSGRAAYHSDLSAAKRLTMAEQLEHAARLEADGQLA